MDGMGGSGREVQVGQGICVVELIPFVVQQKLTRHCKAIILWLKCVMNLDSRSVHLMIAVLSSSCTIGKQFLLEWHTKWFSTLELYSFVFRKTWLGQRWLAPCPICESLGWLLINQYQVPALCFGVTLAPVPVSSGCWVYLWLHSFSHRQPGNLVEGEWMCLSQ